MEICGLWLYFFLCTSGMNKVVFPDPIFPSQIQGHVPSNAILGAQICMAIERCSAFDFLGRQNS